MSQRVIGLDIGSKSIKAVILAVGFKGYEVLDFVEKERDPSLELADELEAFIRTEGIKADVCVAAMPGGKAAVRTLWLPSKKIEQTLPFELEDQIPFPLEKVVYDKRLVSRTADKSKVLVAYSRKDEFEPFLETLLDVGLDPKIVTVDVLAYTSLFGTMLQPSQDGLDAVMDIGHDWTGVCVLEDGSPIAARAVPGGGRNVTKTLAKVFDLPEERAEKGKLVDGIVLTREQRNGIGPDVERVSDAVESALAPLVREVRQTFKAIEADTKKKVKRVLLCGGTAGLRNLDCYLSARLEADVLLFAPGSAAGNNDDKGSEGTQDGPAMAMAMALALAGAGSARRKPVNFRKGVYAYKGDTETVRGKLVQGGVLIGLVVAMLAINSGSKLYFLKVEEARVTDRLKAISKEIVGRPFTEPKKVLSIVEEEIRSGGGGSLGLPEVTALEAFREIANRIPAGANMELKEIMIGDRRCRLKGRTDSLSSVSDFVDRLKGFRCFSDITRGRTGTDVAETGMEFEISMDLACHEVQEKTEEKTDQEKAPHGNKEVLGLSKKKRARSGGGR